MMKYCKYLFRIEHMSDSKGIGIRVIGLTVLNMFIGLHNVNGEHFQLGIGVGPMECSLSLHRWTKWLPL